MKRKVATVLCGIFLAANLYLIQHFFTNQHGDPDRFYHFVVSKTLVDSHSLVLRSLPQVAGLGWDENFIDKEFLFHEVTGLGYKLGGEKGVIAAALLCSLFAIFTLFWFAQSRIPLIPAFAITWVTFFSPLAIPRLILLRPHTLAYFTFTFFVVSILSRRPKITALAAVAFALSYHAFYMPLICLGWLAIVALIFAKGEERKAWHRVAGYGAFGTFAGVLLNPYFPGNIVLGWIHARIPYLMKHDLKHLSFGSELLPAQADDLLRFYIGPFGVLLAVAIYIGTLWRDSREEKIKQPLEICFLLGVCCMFTAMSFQIMRASEYMVPCMGCMLVMIAERVKRWEWKEYSVVGAVVVAQAGANMILLGDALRTPDFTRMNRTFLAAEAIPTEPKNAYVYNCDWDRTPYLMYKRPDLRFTDILDPSLLYFHNKNASWAREDLKNGLVADAYGMIHNAFKADYVFCEDPGIIGQLRLDPGFELIHPKNLGPLPQTQAGVAVFAVKKEPPKNFVTTLEFPIIAAFTKDEVQAYRPSGNTKAMRTLEFPHTSYLNLQSAFGEFLKEEGKDYHCAVAVPEKTAMKNFLGAKYLGVGGGQELKVWRNGKPLFYSLYTIPRAEATHALIPLDTPLVENDRIEVLACSTSKGSFWGTAISFYSKSDIEKICGSTKADPWPFRDGRSEFCVGTVAPKVISP